MDDDTERPAFPKRATTRLDCDEQRPGRRHRSRGERFFAVLTILGVVLLAGGYIWYILSVVGGTRAAAMFAGALALLGGFMLGWSYFRPRDDFLDKLLSGAGQSVLLGAILSFGFAVTGQLAEDERSARDDRRSIAAAIRADAGGKTFPEVDAREQNLAGLDLRDFDFLGADLSGTDLADAYLAGADLTGADLSDAFLFEADLTDALLVDADLTRADLTGADLTGADLTGALLVDADLTRADLAEATLEYADLSGANLTGADLSDADLTGARLSESTVCPDGPSPDEVDGVLTCATG